MNEYAQTIKINSLDKIKSLILLLRLSHWTKALFVMAGCFYAQSIGNWIPALLASLSFCLISSAVYIYNDIEDRSEDILHPRKCNRPLASDRVTVTEAILLLFILLIAGFILGGFVSSQLALILALYVLINVAYNHVLKLIPVLDVACIATGFMLRVFAGTWGIGLPISIWLTIAATLLSLFIALNKRQLEMQLSLKHATRTVLRKYNRALLQWSIKAVGIACFITYLLYILYARDEAFYFVLTLPFAAIALWRFYWLGTQDVDNDDPVSVFLNDRLSRITLYCFVCLTCTALTYTLA
jgi:4-hydroxybenzoate polyprenyltransferase